MFQGMRKVLTEADINHQNIIGAGTYTHAQIDTHIDDATKHFTEASISHLNIANIGTNSHAQIDTHIALVEEHLDWTQDNVGVIHATNYVDNDTTDHTLLSNIGTNTHVQIDTHIADGTLHFLQGAIDHTAILNIGTNTHAQIDTHIASTSNPHTVTKSQVGLSNVPNTDCTDADNISDGLTNAIITLTQETNFETAFTHSGLTSGNPHSVTKTEIGLSNVTDDAQLKRSANDFSSFTNKVTPVSGDILLIEDSDASGVKKYITVGDLPAGGGGEANTASSQGSGTSIYYQKSGVDLQFNAIKSENDRLTVALDAVSHDVELTVNEGNIVHQNISGAGTNTHAQIDTHIGSSSNPHTVTKSQVGLGNVPNVDCTDADNISDGITNAIITLTQETNFETAYTHSGLTSGNPHSVTKTEVSLGNVTNDAQLKRSANDFNSFTLKGTPVSGDVLLIEDSADTGNKKYITVGTLPSSGETNTASNQGTDGVGVYDTKVGVDLQFRHVAPASSKITVVLNVKDIDVDIAEANLVHDHDGVTGGGTVDHVDLSNKGTNTHAQIDTHIADNSQAHSDYLINNGADIMSADVAGALLTLDNSHESGSQPSLVIRGGGSSAEHHVQFNSADNATNTILDKTQLDSIIAHLSDTSDPHSITWAQVDKTVSDIADITTKSHTSLTDIGTNSHVTIDSHIADGTLHFTEASIDHGSIGGLTDDDHNYLLDNAADTMQASVAGALLTLDNTNDIAERPALVIRGGGTTYEHHIQLNSADNLSSTIFDKTQLDSLISHLSDTGDPHSVTWAQLDKTVSNIADITTKSHTSLTDIGSNSHATIDTHLGASNPHSGSAASGANSDITSITGLTTPLDEIYGGTGLATIADGSILYTNATDTLTALTGIAGDDGQYLRFNWNAGDPTISWETPAGSGDVTAAIAFGTDNVLIKSDGVGKGVQATGISVDDSDNVSGVNKLNVTVDCLLDPTVADGASAIAYTFDTANTLTTSAKIASFKNNGTEAAYILNHGGYFAGSTVADIAGSGFGVIMSRDASAGETNSAFIDIWTADSSALNDYSNFRMQADGGAAATNKSIAFDMEAYDAGLGETSLKTDVIAHDTTATSSVLSIIGKVNNTDRYKVIPTVSDGASAVAYLFDTGNTLSTSGAKIISVLNNTVEMFAIGIDASGNIITSDCSYLIGDNYIDITEMTTPSNPSANVARLYCRDEGGTTKLYFRDSVGAETDLGAGAGGGEANTGSNQGTDGVGVFDTKSGVDLQFRHVAPGSSKITTTLNVKDIDIDIVEANLTHDHDGVTGGGTIDHVDLSNKGTNTHANIDTHISGVNPHTQSVGATGTFGTDNVLIRSDSTGRNVQATGIIVTDNDEVEISGTDSVSKFVIKNNVGTKLIEVATTGKRLEMVEIDQRVYVDSAIALVIYDNTSGWEHFVVDTVNHDVTVNGQGQDIDFVVHGQSTNDLIFVDTSVDTVGFGINTPDSGVLVHVEGETYIKATQAVDNSFSVTGLYVDSQLTATTSPKITSFRAYLTHSSVSTGGSAMNNLELKNIFTGSNDAVDSFATYYYNDINTTAGNYTFNNLRGNQTILQMNSACTGTHTITTYRGIQLTALKIASPTATFSGTDWYQIDVGDFGNGAFGGTLTNAYGIYFAEQTYATNNYEAFFEGGGEIFFRDSAIHIGSLTDGHLDLTADISVDINTPDIDLSNQTTNILMKDAETSSFVFKNQSSGFVYLTFDTSGGNIINNVRTIIDGDNAEVFLVRKDNDAGDVFNVDTISSIVTVTGTLSISTALDETYGGTGLTSFTTGDLMYASGTDTLAKLAKGLKGQLLRMDDSATNVEWYTPLQSRSITIENPTNAEDISIFFTNKAITITEMRAVVIGTTPSVTWTIRHNATDRSATGNEVVTGGTATTSTTSGSDVTSFNDATIPADSFVWLETTAQSGTVTELHVTIIFRETTT